MTPIIEFKNYTFKYRSQSTSNKKREIIPAKDIPVMSYIIYVLLTNVITILWLVIFIDVYSPGHLHSYSLLWY